MALSSFCIQRNLTDLSFRGFSPVGFISIEQNQAHVSPADQDIAIDEGKAEDKGGHLVPE